MDFLFVANYELLVGQSKTSTIFTKSTLMNNDYINRKTTFIDEKVNYLLSHITLDF